MFLCYNESNLTDIALITEIQISKWFQNEFYGRNKIIIFRKYSYKGQNAQGGISIATK